MTQTVIGVFDSDPAAEAAVQNLLAVGVESKDIHIHTRPSDIEAMEHPGVGDGGAPRIQHESLLDKVERFLATLVGDDAHPPEFYHYREVVRRGGALVSICVREESQLHVVFTVLEASDARDIDEHAAQWKEELQDEEGMTSRGVSESGISPAGNAELAKSEGPAQAYRVYPPATEAPAAGLAPDPTLPQDQRKPVDAKPNPGS